MCLRRSSIRATPGPTRTPTTGKLPTWPPASRPTSRNSTPPKPSAPPDHAEVQTDRHMTDTSTLEELLAEIGPLAAQDKAAATEEAPQFQALSFFLRARRLRRRYCHTFL